MSFEQNKASKSKNQFSARILSKKTDAMVGWFHTTDDTARKLFGVNSVQEITYAEAVAKLPLILDNERTYVAITDMTAEIEVVAADEF